MSEVFNDAADVLLTGSTLVMFVFLVWHGCTNWRATKMGVHTMTTTAVILLVLSLNTVQRVLDIPLAEDAPWVRTLVYALIFGWVVYRLVLFGWIRRTHLRPSPVGDSTDRP